MTLLQHRVTEQAGRRPDAGALVFKDRRLSYADLEQESNRLARTLKAAGVARGDRVCLLCPKSPAAIIAILAVLKADAIYVPLDPASPAPRHFDLSTFDIFGTFTAGAELHLVPA